MPLSKQHKAALSTAMKARWADPAYRARLTGRRRDPEAVERIRKGQIGKVQTKRHKRAIARGIRRKWRDKKYRRAQMATRERKFIERHAAITDMELVKMAEAAFQRERAKETKDVRTKFLTRNVERRPLD
jgi:hypothetical protein